jgi:ureidoglycolate hydrolase
MAEPDSAKGSIVSSVNRLIEARPLTAADWSPFGWIPLRDTDPRDGKARLQFEWSDVHVNLISHQADEVLHTDRGLVCEKLFRHLTHTQALLVLNCAAAVAVAPAGCTFEASDEAAMIRAFLLAPGDSLVLHRGTWHWGPFPTSEPRVDLYNIQGLRWPEDNDCARLDLLEASVEVVTAHANIH